MTELKAKPRTELGKGVKALRRAGFLPAVVYGEKVASEAISVTYGEFIKVFREVGESTIFKLKIEEGIKRKTDLDVLVYDIKYGPLGGLPLHVDFYAVSMDKPIRKRIPLEFVGESPAVKSEGGILVKVMHEIEIEALPKDLPRELKVGLSVLIRFDSKICVKDLSRLEGVKIFADPDEIVVLVAPPRTEEELTALQETPVAAVEEVKTEREAKKVEEEKVVKEEGVE